MPLDVHEAKANPSVRVPHVCPHSITLRCLAYRDKTSYIAECIDLNLIVRRDSIEQATSTLESAIGGYLVTVLEDRQSLKQFSETGEVKGLLPRPSPLSHRLRYHVYCLIAGILSGNHRTFQLNEYPSSRFATCC